MDLIETYYKLAEAHHRHQKRKYSKEPYVFHPIRVYDLVSSVEPGNLLAKAAALGHDIYEDALSHLTEKEFETVILADIPGELKEGARKVNKTIIELSNVYTKEKFPDLNRAERKELERERLATISVDAATVKIADILDNTKDLLRDDPGFAYKYFREKWDLLPCLTHGNAVLWRRACDFLRTVTA